MAYIYNSYIHIDKVSPTNVVHVSGGGADHKITRADPFRPYDCRCLTWARASVRATVDPTVRSTLVQTNPIRPIKIRTLRTVTRTHPADPLV
ncbi:hypothetical protein H6P81_018568 [Aristolochia fimbriata]|uniref:Uncharacterized protein n=1 Tax=Aristolochia fimbriata TaxID=158543 RepID=A0AAV7E1Q3_ARIFI|nr:hypothetical protein H6P81_018568 [Aristolochia fimbriata]